MNMPNLSLQVLGQDQITRLTEEEKSEIHGASLEILERIGVRLHLQEAMDLLKKAGATLTEDNRVRLPRSLVEWALEMTPKHINIYDRNGDLVMPLEGDRCFYGPGSDCLNILDHRTGERRKPVLRDIAEGTRLCDALSNIGFVMSMVLPSDVDQTIADTFQMEAMLVNTSKPIIMVSYETRGLMDAISMVEAVAGGEESLREKPTLACYINVISGAVHNEDGLTKLLYLAEKGLPAIYIPGSNAGVTSPSTMAGAVALDNAGVLAGLVIAQLKREGTPYIWSAMDGISLDMHTMVSPYAYAERGFMRAMAQYYGIPSFSLAGGSDAKLVDQQATIEASLSILVDTLLGGNIIHDLGYLESGLMFSFVQLVICDEIVNWVKGFLKGIEVSEETLALDVIEQVGTQGQYLATDHTLRHFRDFWYPNLIERGNYEDWVKHGSKSLSERATERVERILEEHRPEPLPDDVNSRIRKIVQQRASD
jgi:trimethylamine--corrinoid protein Co-methyltransferase